MTMAASSPSPPSLAPLARCGERPWDYWLQELGEGRSSPLQDQHRGQHKHRRGVARLRRGSMRLFGEFPGADPLLAAVCCLCGLTVKCCALRDHLLEEHGDHCKDTEQETDDQELESLPAPSPVLAPPPPVKIKSHSRSHSKSRHRHRSRDAVSSARDKSAPRPAPDPLRPSAAVGSPAVTAADSLDGDQTKAELEVSVEEDEPPVVSIRDPADGAEAPSRDALADDIIEIMNSEGIRSVDDAVELQWPVGGGRGNSRTSAGRSRVPRHPFGSEPDPPPPPPPVFATPIAPPVPPAKKSCSRPSKPKCPVREYDPDKHCGVISGESPKPCTRSLTCKSHALSLRRAVEGRSKPFDSLLAEHRAAKQAIVPPPPPRPRRSSPERPVLPPALPPDPPPVSVVLLEPKIEPFSLKTEEVVRFETAAPVEIRPDENSTRESVEDRLADPDPGDVHWYPYEPRPLAVCTFSARRMGDSFFLNRRLAPVRRDFKSLSKSRATSVSDVYGLGVPLASLAKSSQSSGTRVNVPEVRKLVLSCPTLNGTNENGNSVLFCNSAGRQNGHPPAGKRPSGDFDELKCGDVSRGKVSKRTDSMELNFLLDPMMNDEKC